MGTRTRRITGRAQAVLTISAALECSNRLEWHLSGQGAMDPLQRYWLPNYLKAAAGDKPRFSPINSALLEVEDRQGRHD